jgi:sortase A
MLVKRGMILMLAAVCLSLAIYQFSPSKLTLSTVEEMVSGAAPSNVSIEDEPKEDTQELMSILDGEFTILQRVEEPTQAAQVSQIPGITPTRIEIPAIEVDAEIEKVGILENGEMGVPDAMDQVGWFSPGIRPGNKGNAVMAGHVDSRTGPAIFIDLDQLVEGDEVKVSDATGETYTFVVTGSKSYPYDDAPIGEIFGRNESRNLNLITCTGTFDRAEGTHEERLVVFTELVNDELVIEPPSAPTNIQINGSLLSWHAVREELVIGYRLYQSKDGETFDHIGSISAHERKSYFINGETSSQYYLTTVDENGQESEASEIVGGS